MITNIIEHVSNHFNVSAKEIKSPLRRANLTTPRRVAFWLYREVTDYTYDEIGQAFGDRHHTTIMAGVSDINARFEVDQDLRERCEALKVTILPASSVAKPYTPPPEPVEPIKISWTSSKPPADKEDISKQRKCLMCRNEFNSRHIGERVCLNCKDTVAWRGSDAA